MSQPLDPILTVTPVQRGLFDRPVATTPNVAVVYSTGAGQAVYLGGRPLTWKEQTFSSYHTRYDVDVSDHRRTVELRSSPLPSRGDYYFFIATVDVAFRVHDPAEVVRRNIRDALPAVYGFLKNELRLITRNFDIEQSAQAEEAIRRRFATPAQLPEGITVFAVSPRLLPDDNASRYLQEKVEASRRIETNVEQHKVKVQEALQQDELERMQQVARIQATQLEMRAMGNRELTVRQMVQLHLARHPQDTEKVTAMLMQHEQTMLERQDQQAVQSTELTKFLVAQHIFQAADLEHLVQPLLRQMGAAPAQTAIPAISWSQSPVLPAALGSDPGPAHSPAVVPAQDKPPAVVLAQDPGTKVWKPADGVQPIYLVVDESAEAAPYIGDLSNGVHLLHEALLQAGDIASGIWLAVLGFADELATRRPMEPIMPGAQSPWFAPHGPADYAATFEKLLDIIDQDIPLLKEQQPKVLRPTVYLLSASTAADGSWTVPYQRLTDRDAHRYAPNIVACGFGAAPPKLIAEIATNPKFGYIMAPGTDTHDALAQYWRSLTRYILAVGRALVNGNTDVTHEPPAGFKLARDLV